MTILEKRKIKSYEIVTRPKFQRIINNSLKHFSVFAYFLIKLCYDDILI